jgi:hypothetical protein
MSGLTRTKARDEMLARARETLLSLRPAILEKHVVYVDSAAGEIPSRDLAPLPPWARVQVQHGPGANAAITGGLGQQCVRREGILTVQLFTPIGGQVQADEFSEAIEAAFINYSTPGGVWFRNVRSNEIGQDGPWFQTNILSDFEYHKLI